MELLNEISNKHGDQWIFNSQMGMWCFALQAGTGKSSPYHWIIGCGALYGMHGLVRHPMSWESHVMVGLNLYENGLITHDWIDRPGKNSKHIPSPSQCSHV